MPEYEEDVAGVLEDVPAFWLTNTSLFELLNGADENAEGREGDGAQGHSWNGAGRSEQWTQHIPGACFIAQVESHGLLVRAHIERDDDGITVRAFAEETQHVGITAIE